MMQALTAFGISNQGSVKWKERSMGRILKNDSCIMYEIMAR